MKPENIALFDLDGTLCDYHTRLSEDLEKLRNPVEERYKHPVRDGSPDYIRNRADLIRSTESWWENLPKLQLGWDVLKVARQLDYRTVILTQGPRRNPFSWSGKKKWVDKNLGNDADITITRDKSQVYGRVLVDDFPSYIEGWLKWRNRGLVIMPTNEENRDFKHEQVIRYDGSNLEEVTNALQRAKIN